jgi:hypothetical protein
LPKLLQFFALWGCKTAFFSGCSFKTEVLKEPLTQKISENLYKGTVSPVRKRAVSLSMDREMDKSPAGDVLYSLVPLEDFKAILCLDSREDFISRYCLTTATYTIEHYCRRRLVKKINNERLTVNNGELLLPLREYPVREIISISNEQLAVSNGVMIEPEFYRVIPDCGDLEDVPHCLSLSPALNRSRIFTAIKAVYWAGYDYGDSRGVPVDLASACLELATWNMARYRGRRIGMTGNVRGNAKDGEHREASMPENVRQLLEPYRRRTI